MNGFSTSPGTTGRRIWLLAALIAALLGGCRTSAEGDRAASSDDTIPASAAINVADAARRETAEPLELTVKDLAGKPVNLKDWRGHPVIIEFWATWCGPCRKEMPELNEIYRRYRSKGLVILGVSLDAVQGDGIEAVEPFIEDFKILYPIAMADEALVEKLALEAVPTTLLVGRDGRVLARIEGAGDRGELTKAAEDLLKR